MRPRDRDRRRNSGDVSSSELAKPKTFASCLGRRNDDPPADEDRGLTEYDFQCQIGATQCSQIHVAGRCVKLEGVSELLRHS